VREESDEEMRHVHLKFVSYHFSFWFFFRIGSETFWKVGTKSFRIYSTALNSRQNSIPKIGSLKEMSHEIPGVAGCGERRVKAGARRVTRSCGLYT
jgi:hypothetical protein